MRASLLDVARSHTLRCDPKQSEQRFRDFDARINGALHWTLGERLPNPIMKGAQPDYLDSLDESGIPVISTMAVQNLSIDTAACRRVAEPDYGADDVRKPQIGDVLLTVDGGPSIGKPALFELDGDWAVDSHVAILRPAGVDPSLLVYLLASPLGQIQFQRAESGASGQTAVTEDDLRRFVFPELTPAAAEEALAKVHTAQYEADRLRTQAAATQDAGWEEFLSACAPGL